VIAVHALIVAAADDRTTPVRAAEIDAIYLSISTLATTLDALIDHDADASAGELGANQMRHYEDRAQLAASLTRTLTGAVARARDAPHGAHHVMILVGVVARYTSTAAAGREFARPITAHVNRQLRPLITPSLAIWRVWRTAKRHRRDRMQAFARG
jgi:hypothetical protein